MSRALICHLVQADDALELFEQLKAQHRDVSLKTKSLHDSCERLVSKERHADARFTASKSFVWQLSDGSERL